MYEIELKAHVDNYENTKNTINSFARFLETKTKIDVYWHMISEKSKNPVRVRVRQETTLCPNGEKTTETIVTYKKKELRQSTLNDNAISYEVNEENELNISNKQTFESILIDAGFAIDLKKEKHVLQWEIDGVLLELCTITDLGNFLELEIMAENNEDSTIKKSIGKLKSLLLQCGIPLEKIEKRYYSELLKENKGVSSSPHGNDEHSE